MLTGIKYLDWDSKFFEFPIGISRNFPSNLDWYTKLNKENIKLVYFFIDPEDKKSILNGEKYGAQLVDIKILYQLVFQINSEIIPNSGNGYVIEEYKGKNTDQKLIDLAILSGTYSRFQKDKNIDNRKFIELYSHWIDRSVKHEIADYVMIVKSGIEIIALATLELKNKVAKIGLFAVDKKFQGKKIGKLLMDHIRVLCIEQNINLIEVYTQKENIAACKFYEACGFYEKSNILVYHYWNT